MLAKEELAKDRLRSEYTKKDNLVVELREELVDKIDKLVNEAGEFRSMDDSSWNLHVTNSCSAGRRTDCLPQCYGLISFSIQ